MYLFVSFLFCNTYVDKAFSFGAPQRQIDWGLVLLINLPDWRMAVAQRNTPFYGLFDCRQMPHRTDQ